MALNNPITGPRRQLAQSRPGVTTSLTAWTVPYFGQYDIHLINVVNTHASTPVNISIFHDPTGAVYDEDSALVYNYTLAAGDIFQFEADGSINGYQNAGTIGIQVSVANLANFKIYGALADETVRPI